MSRCLVFLVAFVVLSITGSARASGLDITPVRVHLNDTQRSETLTLVNNSADRVRYQVTASAWQEDAAGQPTLTGSQDLVVFPSLFEMKPGTTKRIKVASRVGAGPAERTYRVVIEQLPDGTTPKPGSIRVLTKFSVPVFVQPPKPKPKAAVTMRIDHGRLIVTVSNAGNSYFVTRSVQIVAKDGSTTLLDQIINGWYVLAGGQRVYELELSSGSCSKMSSAVATLKTESETVHETVHLQSASCAP